MKNVKLFIYNYGKVQIADFKNHYHDAVQCMKLLNDTLTTNYGKLPDSIFYYVEYKIKSSGRLLYYVDSNSGLNIAECDSRIDKLQIIEHSA